MKGGVKNNPNCGVKNSVFQKWLGHNFLVSLNIFSSVPVQAVYNDRFRISVLHVWYLLWFPKLQADIFENL